VPTNSKTKTKRATARKSNPKSSAASARASSISAIELLKNDHREVDALFEEYEDLEDDATKAELAEKICKSLRVHTQIEEEIFYPAARKATGDEDLLDEAIVEHAGAKHLIGEIESMEVGEDLYDAKIRVLGEQIRHHVREEEEELFPEVEASEVDLVGVGKELAERKMELMEEVGMTVAQK
jgi:hemerythrin superfamily protein